MTAALSNNLNELDLLLQDLSAARYSGHIERKETVTESRVYSSQTQNGDGEHGKTIGQLSGRLLDDGPDPRLELHAVERSRTEKSAHTVADNGNDESKWEYMGFGIWENRDGSASPHPSQVSGGYRNSPGPTNQPAARTNGNPVHEKYVYEEKTVIQEHRNGYGNSGSGSGYTPSRKDSVPERTIAIEGRGNGFLQQNSSFQEEQSTTTTTTTFEQHNNNINTSYELRKSSQDDRSNAGYLDDRSNGFHDDRNSGYQVDRAGASNATQELDDLMTSLNNFKMSDRQVDEPVIPPNLDTMLGNLQEDMDKQGVKTTQKGICGACRKPIVGQVVTALGYTWHPEHFTCAHCNQELGSSNFFERDGKPYCEQDYHHLFSPRCGYCSGPILDKCISALDNTWHPEHFLCSGCGKHLGEEGFHEREDSAYCKDCYFNNFAPRCGGCNLPITENYISSLNQQWHPNCFVCKECNSPFTDGAFFEHDGFPYCETHYHALRGSLCAGCHKPISGRCITAMFRKFHPEHFVCSFCLKQLNKGTFKEQGDKPYCHECFDRLFG